MDWPAAGFVDAELSYPHLLFELNRAETADGRVTPHVATQMNALGMQDTTVDRVLSHVIPGVSGVYNKHKYLDEKRAALERWATFLVTLL